MAESLSWRDPDGIVFNSNGRILRAISQSKVADVRELLQAPWLNRLVENGDLPRTAEIFDPPAIQGQAYQLWLEHDRLVFPCYAHEITALQLFDAGQLTLKIAIEAAHDNWSLKDASAWNVLFSRGRPVFVDFLSFERADASGTWAPYGQFARHFLLPLLLYRKLGITPQDVFSTHRDGITPERAKQLLHGWQLVSLTALEHIVLPNWLSNAGGRMIAEQSKRKPRRLDAVMGAKLRLNTLRRLQSSLDHLRPDRSDPKSVWRSYEEDRLHYSEADLAAKKEFVLGNLGDSRSVLDLGCNAGEFSLLASENGKRTVAAADFDHSALSRLYAKIRGQRTTVTPLILNIGRPTPAVGWQNAEVPSILDRAASQFDCILCLGLVHHLLVSERATLSMLADLFGRLDAKRVILEWVSPQDEKFRQVAGLNIDLYKHLTMESLEGCFRPKFDLVTKVALPGNTRVMYLWSRRSSSGSATKG